jgi:MFS transporter, DHA2 family, multidrug resistance protein
MASLARPAAPAIRAASPSLPEAAPHRKVITACAMTATLMQALDSTIANVALPYMQGSLSTTSDEITWVLTSYVIAAAIMTAPVGWLTMRFGRKNLFITCLCGFVVTSMMCGAAQSLTQMVLFRLAQGMCGAALVPLSQATMLDIYPFEQRAQAMAIFGMGVMVGPILGPTLGGYLTETYNWRWVFYVNVPFGLVAITGLALFLPRTARRPEMRFDWTGFAVLALGVGCMQMMLDRGQDKDWFSSREIITEAVLSGLGLYLFVVHMLTAKKPFIPPAVFKDRNFVASCIMTVCTGMLLLSTSALLAPFLQDLSGYPVETAGFALAPRGFGTMAAMLLASRLGMHVDQRKIMAVGLLLLGWSLHSMSTWTPDVSQHQMMGTLLAQGFSVGLIFNPLTVMAFTTLPPVLRGDATALQSLARNTGAAVGISVTTFMLARGTQVSHADLAAGITPFQRELQGQGIVSQLLDPLQAKGAALLDQIVTQQAQIIAYNNDFRMMTFVVLVPLLLLPLMRRHRRQPKPAPGQGTAEIEVVAD